MAVFCFFHKNSETGQPLIFQSVGNNALMIFRQAAYAAKTRNLPSDRLHKISKHCLCSLTGTIFTAFPIH
nr:MAG TPA: hypothetical protein [Caudoviricetes sp.]